MKFRTVHLESNEVVVQWDSESWCSSSYGGQLKLELGDSKVVLPPMRPSSLLVEVMVYVNDLLLEVGGALYKQLQECFVRGSKSLWEEQLHYDTISDGLSVHCSCKVWSGSKIDRLVAKDDVVYLNRLVLVGRFYGCDIGIQTLVDICNEYFVSLFVSQLEWQYPLVFSIMKRDYLLTNLVNIGTLSFGLTSTDKLITPLINIVSNDNTLTTIHNVIQYKHKKKQYLKLFIVD